MAASLECMQSRRQPALVALSFHGKQPCGRFNRRSVVPACIRDYRLVLSDRCKLSQLALS